MHVAIPAEILLYEVLRSETMLLVESALSLQIAAQVVVVREVEAFGEVLCDFAHDLSYLVTVKVLNCGRILTLLLDHKIVIQLPYIDIG